VVLTIFFQRAIFSRGCATRSSAFIAKALPWRPAKWTKGMLSFNRRFPGNSLINPRSLHGRPDHQIVFNETPNTVS
jgi:hypothetical protein